MNCNWFYVSKNIYEKKNRNSVSFLIVLSVVLYLALSFSSNEDLIFTADEEIQNNLGNARSPYIIDQNQIVLQGEPNDPRNFSASNLELNKSVSKEYRRVELTLDESEVFKSSLNSSSLESNDGWELNIGKGGQIYSLITKNGELLPDQSLFENGRWIDRVMQLVMVNGEKNTKENPYFIHGAGTYAKDGLDSPFFSPTFNEELITEDNSYRIDIWPQQAHIPTPHSSDVIIQKEITDLGSGVIQVDYVVNNYGSDNFNFTNVPWTGINREDFPNFVHGDNENDGWVNAADIFYEQNGWGDNIVQRDEINGWLAMTRSINNESLGVGMVVGLDSGGPIRFGLANPSDKLGIIENISTNKFEANTSTFVRYFLIVNTVGKIQEIANQLKNDAFVYKIDNTPDLLDPKNIKSVCKNVSNEQLRVTYVCNENEDDIFKINQKFVPGAIPLFYISNGELIGVTSNPYIFSQKPYDRNTNYLGFLGWSYKNLPNITNAECMYEDLSGNLDSIAVLYGSDISNSKVLDDDYLRCLREDEVIENPIYTPNIGFDYNLTRPKDQFKNRSLDEDAIEADDNDPIVPTTNNSDDLGLMQRSILPVNCGSLDVNENKILDVTDLSAFLKKWRNTCNPEVSYGDCGPKDTNQDEVIDIKDLSNIIPLYRQNCVKDDT